MSEYRVALLGAGARAYAHADTDRRIENVTLCGCMDISTEHREKLAAHYGIQAYFDPVEMIRREKPDLVHIVTPPGARVPLMRLVNEMGVPACTVEKPIALGVEDWRALCQLEKTARTKFAVCHQFRWHPDQARCREALLSGTLGRVLAIEATAGMDITNQGTHALHYGNALNGDREVVEVFGATSGWEGQDADHPGPETTAAMLTFDDGTRMLWNTGPTAPRVGDPCTTWQHVRIAAFAERGRVLWEEFGRWEIVGPEGVECGDFGGMEEWSRNNGAAQEAFHRAMLAWIEDDGRPVGTNLARSLHEWKVVLALYASALTRKPVEMRSFDPPSDLVDRLQATLTA